jgi:acyl carrier protein
MTNMTDPNTIRSAVYSFLEEVSPGIVDSDPPFTDDVRLDFYIDSFHMVNLTLFLETTFKIKIRDSEAIPANLGTVTSIINFVRSKESK